MPLPTPLIEALPLPGDARDYLPWLSRQQAPVALIGGGQHGWDLLSANPTRLLHGDGTGCRIQESNPHSFTCRHESPFAVLERWHDETATRHSSELPFLGGLIGYWGYESGLPLNALPASAQADALLPSMQVGDYRWALLRERSSGQWYSVAETRQQTDWIRQQWPRIVAQPANSPLHLHQGFQASHDADDYRQAMARIQHYLQSGDCYQVNLARHFSADYHGDPLTAFLHIARQHEAAYSAYLGLADGKAILSFSPENFLSLNAEGNLSTRPIKGTRPRHADPAEDQRLLADLQNSPKDRAENLMIVDLLRNDLGRCCLPGSIQTTALFQTETHPNVHHLVSTVQGQLQPDLSPVAALARCFPGGSITGAPKRRAMQIIAELENLPRSVYCGSIGFISRHGMMDLSIAIRTLVADGQRLHCWGGSGVVADSKVEAEYQECNDKVDRFLHLLQEAFLTN